jgi:tRNA-dihydrouridine synthase
MIARGSHGAPWVFTQARAALEGQPILADPDVHERFAVMLEHARNAIAFEREERRAMLELRKHLGWYTKGLPGGKALRQELFGVHSLGDVEARLAGYLERAERFRGVALGDELELVEA